MNLLSYYICIVTKSRVIQEIRYTFLRDIFGFCPRDFPCYLLSVDVLFFLFDFFSHSDQVFSCFTAHSKYDKILFFHSSFFLNFHWLSIVNNFSPDYYLKRPHSLNGSSRFHFMKFLFLQENSIEQKRGSF